MHASDLPWRGTHTLTVPVQTLPAASSAVKVTTYTLPLPDRLQLLDAKAKQAYRRRLAEIDEDIEQARGLGEAGRAARAPRPNAPEARSPARSARP